MNKQVFSIGVFIFLMSMPFYLSRSQDALSKLPFDKIELKFKNSYSAEIASSAPLLRNLQQDTNKPVTDTIPKTNKKFRMRKSPTLAVLLSAVIPGAGQLYNGSYWKIPVIDGLIAYFGYEYLRNNNKFKDYRDQYNATITPENPFGDASLKSLREFYRSQRDDFVWYFLIVYVVNLVDAYVDAHLFDFDVREEKLTRFGKPDKTYRLKMNINF